VPVINAGYAISNARFLLIIKGGGINLIQAASEQEKAAAKRGQSGGWGALSAYPAKLATAL